MRYRLAFCFLAGTLVAPRVQAASCPNPNSHPGITTLYVQSDFGEKEQASKAYVASLQEAIKKSAGFCLIDDVRAVSFSLNVTGIDIDEEHERAAMSVVLISERNTLVSHFIRLSTVANVDKNAQDDVVKVERAIQRTKRQH